MEPNPPPQWLSKIQPKRSRFQLHLSTCVVMMFAAGAVMYLNALNMRPVEFHQYFSMWQSPSFPKTFSDLKPEDANSDAPYYRTRQYGWPYPIYQVTDCVKAGKDAWILDEKRTQQSGERSIQYPYLVHDVACALAILVFSALAAELLARRLARNRKL